MFLTATLGASAGMLGLIEGAAETTASILKLASGWWSDRVARRKQLVVVGYLIATVRPLVAIAQTAGQVLAIRISDRIGKGIRTSPRDALIAESVDPSIRGRAFGFHRAMDNAGGVVGPLVAFVLLQYLALDLRTVFWLAVVPAVLAIITVVFFVKEAPRVRGEPAAVVGAEGAPVVAAEAGALPKPFWAYLGVLFVFTLGSSTDAFLLLRANQLGVPIVLAPIIWATLHVVKSSTSTAGGALSDRIGRVPTMMLGWVVYAVVYLGFALATQAWHAWALFIVYGLFFGLTEGPERALVADFVPAGRRGTAFGWFNLMLGIGLLPASVLFGVVWDRFGSSAAFYMGAGLAAVAAIGLTMIPKPTADLIRINPDESG